MTTAHTDSVTELVTITNNTLSKDEETQIIGALKNANAGVIR